MVDAGHFYSPIPDMAEVENEKDILLSPKDSFGGIDLNIPGQMENLEALKQYYPEIYFKEKGQSTDRFYCPNDSYSHCDAEVLYCMLRHLRPKFIIEAGAGFTTAIMADVNEKHFNCSMDIRSIEPYPQVAESLLQPGERGLIMRQKIQEIPLDFFKGLSDGDILFIDSSHVGKVGSDVNYLIHEVLPILKEGVYVHFHDIFHNFNYPIEWLRFGWFWNEAYLIRAFLEFNDSFEIFVFNSYMTKYYPEWFEKNMPTCLKNNGGSLWLRKKK